jgi:predicted ester cyclase
MSIEDNKALARRYVEALHPQKNLVVLDKLCVPDLVIHGSSGRIIQGLETYKQIQAASLQRFSDLQVTIEDQFAEGDRSVLRYAERGMYTGPIKGIPQTGKPFQTTGISIFHHAADGKIVEVWDSPDTLGLMQQLGVIPAIETMD